MGPTGDSLRALGLYRYLLLSTARLFLCGRRGTYTREGFSLYPTLRRHTSLLCTRRSLPYGRFQRAHSDQAVRALRHGPSRYYEQPGPKGDRDWQAISRSGQTLLDTAATSWRSVADTISLFITGCRGGQTRAGLLASLMGGARVLSTTFLGVSLGLSSFDPSTLGDVPSARITLFLPSHLPPTYHTHLLRLYSHTPPFISHTNSLTSMHITSIHISYLLIRTHP